VEARAKRECTETRNRISADFRDSSLHIPFL
jgi:hypothetical protein